MNIRMLSFLLITVAFVGCASTKMINISPEKVMPTVTQTINAEVKVRCSDPLSSANDDVANFLEKEGVFRSAVAISENDNISESDIELYVIPNITENDYFGEKMGKAVARGLLLGLADQAFAEKYDYEVHLKVILKKESIPIKTYESIGKYHAEQPESKKSSQASEARKLAWEHALKLLAAKIKEDQRNIAIEFWR